MNFFWHFLWPFGWGCFSGWHLRVVYALYRTRDLRRTPAIPDPACQRFPDWKAHASKDR